MVVKNMNLKISVLKSSLSHSVHMIKENEQFIKNLEKELDTSIIFSDITDYNCDLKLIFVETGGSEGLFLKNFDNLKEPYYLLTNGANNSLAASLEIMTHLKLNNLNGEILHGNYKYLASRIKSLAMVNNAKKKIQNSKLGLIGKPSDWLISSIPNFESLKNIFGIDIMHISLEEVEKKSRSYSFIKDTSFKDSIFDQDEKNKALKIYKAIKAIVDEHNLNGFSIRCFDLLTSLHSTGCLALANLNDEGVIGCCEGDVMAMVSMLIASSLTNEPTFQANPSRIDVDSNEVVFAHCTIPLKMTTDYRLDTHFESGLGVAVKGNLELKKVTVFRLSSNLKDYTIMSGEIIENLNEKNLCRTQIKVKFRDDVGELLMKPCGNHHIIFYGDYKNELEMLLAKFTK